MSFILTFCFGDQKVIILYIIAKFISITISAVVYAMMGRAILPFFVDPEENKIYFFLTVITEPFIVPVRFIMAKLNIGQNTPIDLSFFFTYILLIVVQGFLPVI